MALTRSDFQPLIDWCSEGSFRGRYQRVVGMAFWRLVGDEHVLGYQHYQGQLTFQPIRGGRFRGPAVFQNDIGTLHPDPTQLAFVTIFLQEVSVSLSLTGGVNDGVDLEDQTQITREDSNGLFLDFPGNQEDRYTMYLFNDIRPIVVAAKRRVG